MSEPEAYLGPCQTSVTELYCKIETIPTGNYMLKVNNRNTRTRCEICSELIIRYQNNAWHRCDVFIVNFKHILRLVVMLLLLTLNMQLPAGRHYKHQHHFTVTSFTSAKCILQNYNWDILSCFSVFSSISNATIIHQWELSITYVNISIHPKLTLSNAALENSDTCSHICPIPYIKFLECIFQPQSWSPLFIKGELSFQNFLKKGCFGFFP